MSPKKALLNKAVPTCYRKDNVQRAFQKYQLTMRPPDHKTPQHITMIR
jgi:hypothetical protein